MIALSGLIVIVMLYVVPGNVYIYNSIINRINEAILNSRIVGKSNIIDRMINSIGDRFVYTIYPIIVILIIVGVYLILMVVNRMLFKVRDYNLEATIEQYLEKYSRGTSKINLYLTLATSFFLIIMALLKRSDVRVYVLGILLISFVYRTYKMRFVINGEDECEIDNSRYTEIEVPIKVEEGYKTLVWSYNVDPCGVEKPIIFNANIKEESDEGIQELSQQIKKACDIKELKYKQRIEVVLSLVSSFENRIDREENDELSTKEVLLYEKGNDVELGKCASEILKGIGFDVEEIYIPLEDGRTTIAFYVEGADKEPDDDYYIKNNKKYYYCNIINKNEYYIGKLKNNKN